MKWDAYVRFILQFKALLVAIKKKELKRQRKCCACETVLIGGTRFWIISTEIFWYRSKCQKLEKQHNSIPQCAVSDGCTVLNRILHCCSLTLAVYRTNRSSWCITKLAMETCLSGSQRRQWCYLMLTEPYLEAKCCCLWFYYRQGPQSDLTQRSFALLVSWARLPAL